MGASPVEGDRPDYVEAETVRVPPPSEPAPTTPIDDSRFAAGTLLAGRYRIVGRIGRGGMGEVYRADDLKLGQSVALKFLPEALARDVTWLRRFHDEVRIAREVAHPNVCRVYDIGEIDGEHFITMEYVDGEDLALLLRRIGRLPKDKAIQIARQLCGGLAAAHDKGVPQPMAPAGGSGQVTWNDPPLETPGMVRLRLDPEGRLNSFESVAPAVMEESTRTDEPDWSALFAAAGLEPAAFKPVAPMWTPSVYCDTRAAWDGTYPEAPDLPLRIEAGGFAGRPAYFELIGPWKEPPGSSSQLDSASRFFATSWPKRDR